MNQLVRAVRPPRSREKRVKVPEVSDRSTGQPQPSYRYETGRINRGNQKPMAVVIDALPDRRGFFADRVLNGLVTEILAVDPSLPAEVESLWVFIRTPSGLHVAPWQRFNLRIDEGRKVSVVGSPQGVPSQVTQQLEALFA
jgi:hypothetical protein